MTRTASLLLLAAATLGAQPATPAGPVGMPGPAIGSPNRQVEGKPADGKATPGTRPAATPARPAATPAAGPSYRDLKYPPLRPVQLPKVDVSTLPNGMRLFLLEDRELPLVNGTALVRTGTLFDPPDKVGLANLTVTAMRSAGAGKATADQVNERLENAAGSVEASVTSTSATITFSALKETTAEVLAIFKDVLAAPRFDDAGMDQVRTQMRNAIAHRNDEGPRIAHRELSDILYGRGTAYGREQQYSTLGRIERADVTAFHDRYFFPRNTILAIRGDFDAAAMKAQIGKLFADWTAEQPPPAFPVAAASPADAPGTYVAVKKELRQTSFAMGQLGGRLDDKDYAALTLMADILGGGYRGRIAQRLRDFSTGGGPPVSAKWDAGYDYPGLFEIGGTVNSGSTVEIIKAIREEVARIRTSEVTDEELRVSKEGAINSLVFAFDTKAKTLGRLMGYEYYGYPADFIDQYQKALAAVTKADILRVAKERLKPEQFATVVAGDPVDFVPPLESLGQPGRPIDLAIPQPTMEAVKSDAGSVEKGKALLGRMQRAVGGLERLAAVNDSTTVADYLIYQGPKVTPVRHTEHWMTPMHYREDNDIGGGTISSYFDGSFGWISVPGGSVPLSGGALQQVHGNCFRQFVLLLQGGKFPDGTVNAVDDVTVEIRGGWGESARIEINPDTGLPARIRYESPSAGGPRMLTEEAWSDYREVSGIRFPFQISITQGGRKYADVTVSEFKVNSGLKLPDLERRP